MKREPNKVKALPTHDDLIVPFEKLISTNYSDNALLKFLRAQSIRLRGFSEDEIASCAEVIADFFDKFISTFDTELVQKDYVQKWGSEAEILVVGDRFSEERFRRAQKKFYESLPKFAKDEAQSLVDTLCAIQKERELTFCFNGDDTINFDLPAKIPENIQGEAKWQLLVLCATLIVEGGILSARCFEKGSGVSEYFAICLDESHKWFSAPVDQLRRVFEDSCKKATPPSSVPVFVEIQRPDNSKSSKSSDNQNTTRKTFNRGELLS